MSGQPIDPGVIALAGRVLDLARGGRTDELAAHLDAGVPPDLPATTALLDSRA